MEHYFTNNKNLKEDIKEINVKVKDTEFIFYTDNGVFNKEENLQIPKALKNNEKDDWRKIINEEKE